MFQVVPLEARRKLVGNTVISGTVKSFYMSGKVGGGGGGGGGGKDGPFAGKVKVRRVFRGDSSLEVHCEIIFIQIMFQVIEDFILLILIKLQKIIQKRRHVCICYQIKILSKRRPQMTLASLNRAAQSSSKDLAPANSVSPHHDSATQRSSSSTRSLATTIEEETVSPSQSSDCAQAFLK